jgi:glycosyltransferase involved in cell wall biosynthesis
MKPLITVLTGTTGRKELQRNIESVAKQTYDNIRHLVFVDGEEAQERIENNYSLCAAIDKYKVDIINLPFSIGNNRWNSHRHYGAGTYIADGEYVTFLDDDNTLDPEHLLQCYNALNAATITSPTWSYSLRKIVTTEGEFLCNDDCESLGNWASVIHPQDFFVDVNCYFLPKLLAVYVSPIWYRKFREPGQPEVDRMLCHHLRSVVPGICTGQYSVNYAVASNSQLSVKPEFFEQGNAEMLKRYNGVLPWVK